MVYRSAVDRLLADSRPIYRTAIFWLSTKCRPTIDRVSTNYWLIHQLSAKCRRSIGERKAISAETHLERLSTVSRLSVDRLSTNYRPLYRPTVDRVSTECRPTFHLVSTDISVVDITHKETRSTTVTRSVQCTSRISFQRTKDSLSAFKPWATLGFTISFIFQLEIQLEIRIPP